MSSYQSNKSEILVVWQRPLIWLCERQHFNVFFEQFDKPIFRDRDGIIIFLLFCKKMNRPLSHCQSFFQTNLKTKRYFEIFCRNNLKQRLINVLRYQNRNNLIMLLLFLQKVIVICKYMIHNISHFNLHV